MAYSVMVRSIAPEDNEIIADVVDVDENDAALCPMCGADLPLDAIECPECGEPFSPEAFEYDPEKEKRRKVSKQMFWAGVILVFLGGPGIALFSWLHDVLELNFPSGYDAWTTFGWVNKLVATVGMVILVIGIVLLILSIHRERPEDIVEDQELYELT